MPGERVNSPDQGENQSGGSGNEPPDSHQPTTAGTPSGTLGKADETEYEEVDDLGVPVPVENKEIERIAGSLPPEEREKFFAVIRQVSTSHSGWLPTPAFMREYEEVLPGLAERIVLLPEREQAHRHTMTDSIVRRDYRLRTTGQWMGMGALVLILLFCAFLAVLGNTTAAAWVAAAVIIGTVGIFVTGQVSGNSTSSKDLIEKAD